MSKKVHQIQMSSIVRLGFANEEIDGWIPAEFSSLELQPSDDERFTVEIANIISQPQRLIELIIIPDRYFVDLEVLQTVQVRDVYHTQRGGIGVVMTSSDAHSILQEKIFPAELLTQVYKISTIRHGIELETKDPNADLMIEFAKQCVFAGGAGTVAESKLCEIVIRACGGAGPLHSGLADPETLVPIGELYDHSSELDEVTAEQSRLFLHGLTTDAEAQPGCDEYKTLKLQTIRTQTLNLKNIALTDPNRTNVLFAMRELLNAHSDLRHLSVKSYYDVVNPVPEGDHPVRMGLWFASRRVAKLSFPKAVRLLSPDLDNSGEDGDHVLPLTSIHHLVRPLKCPPSLTV